MPGQIIDMSPIIQMVVSAEVQPDACVPEAVPEQIAFIGIRRQGVRMTDPKRRGMAVNKSMRLFILPELIIEPGLIYSVGIYVLSSPTKKAFL